MCPFAVQFFLGLDILLSLLLIVLTIRVSPFSKKFSKQAANHFFITYGYPKWPGKSLSALAHKLISRWIIEVLVLQLCSEIHAVCNFMRRHSFLLSKLSANALRQWVWVYLITTKSCEMFVDIFSSRFAIEVLLPLLVWYISDIYLFLCKIVHEN